VNKFELVKVEKVDRKLINEIVKRIVKALTPLKIILFGSWAYGKPHKDSDLDILVVVKKSELPRYKRAVQVYKALTGILISKDIIVYTPQEIKEWNAVPQAFITTIIRKGKVIYEKKI
jgi:predicted nucleotidyltransferase